ncbi:Domain of uncharacterised function (DUF1983) [Suttonella ornithocola]|nr:Domain of uncharacterised function (DUF1983) [Suttonella ornithocola]
MVDKKGNIGNWSGEIKGQPSQDPAPILEQINGQITQSVLHQDLVDQLNNIEAVVTPPMAGDAINYAGDNTVFAGVWSLSSAIQAGDLAQAEKTDLVLSQVNDAKAAIQQTSKTVVDLKKGTSALYTLAAIATDGEGKPVIGGITVGVDGKTASSEILLQADKLMLWSGDKKPMFAIVNGKTAINGDLIADGTILGQHIKANQTLSAPNISGGQLDIGGGRGRFRVENDGHVSITSSGRSGLTITNESIEVRDDNGVLRVKIGKL